MAKYLIWLLFLLGTNNVLAQACYCTTSWHYNSTFGQSCTANADCWACQQGAYNTSWQQAFCPNVYAAPVPVTCTTTFTEKTESCQINYSGIKRYKQETRTCTDGQVTQSGWQLYSNSCVQNPPTCQTQSQTQTLSCQTGYTGSTIQTRTSSCPDPYGQPVFAPWATISDTCKKSLSNPTNPTSPVSPISPVSPSAVTASPTAAVPSTINNPVTNPVTNPAASVAPTQQTQQTTPPEPPKGMNQKSVVGRVLSLEQKVGAVVQRMNPFPTATINQELPLEIRQNNKFLMDILSSGSITESIGIKQITKDTVEYEQ